MYFNHIGSRLSTETSSELAERAPDLHFNHIGSRLSTETTPEPVFGEQPPPFQPHRLTVEH